VAFLLWRCVVETQESMGAARGGRDIKVSRAGAAQGWQVSIFGKTAMKPPDAKPVTPVRRTETPLPFLAQAPGGPSVARISLVGRVLAGQPAGFCSRATPPEPVSLARTSTMSGTARNERD